MDGVADGEGGTATGVTVEFGEDYAVEVEPVVECFCGVDCVLAGHGVDNEEGFLWVEGGFKAGDFVHHLFVNSETTGGIDNDNVGAFEAGVLDGFGGDVDGVGVAFFGEDGNLDLLSQCLELADSGGAVDVAGDQHDAFVFLVFEVVCQFGGEGGFTRALETGDEDDCRSAFGVDVDGLGTHEFGEFLVDDFHH